MKSLIQTVLQTQSLAILKVNYINASGFPDKKPVSLTYECIVAKYSFCGYCLLLNYLSNIKTTKGSKA